MALTGKRLRFVQEYLVDLDAKNAATRAGYSARTAHQIGYELLRTPEVAQAIDKAMKARATRTGLQADRVIEELSRIAFSDIRDVIQFDKDGVHVTASADLDPDAARTISGVEEGEHGMKVRLHDKPKALELLARHLGLLNDKLNLGGGLTVKTIDMTGKKDEGDAG